MNTESTEKIEETTNGQRTVSTVNALWPNVPEEIVTSIDKKVMLPFKMFDTMNACSALVTKITELGGAETLATTLKEHYIIVRNNEDGTVRGLELQLDAIILGVLGEYGELTIEYAIACFFAGILQKTIAEYDGPTGSLNAMLQLVTISMCKDSEITLEQCLERIDTIIEKN